MRPTFILAVLPLALAACDKDAPQPDKTATASEVGAVAPSATPSAPAQPSSTADPSPNPLPTSSDTSGIPEFGIPVALQGSWGLVPADCTSKRGDAKGLLRVSATTLTFYESVGKLGTIKDRTDKSIRADFAFSGEGMTWSRDETLALSNDDKQLTRTERGGDEPGGPFIYKKCVG
jgi:hypothetical protein